MVGRYLPLLLVGFLLLPLVQSQAVFQRPQYFVPKKIFVIGKGIITEMDNPLEFEPVKIFVGKIVVYVPGINDWVDADTGILKVGNKTYKLIPITLENKTFEANLIDRTTGETVGRIYVEYVVKYWQGLWVGDLELNNKSYYVYIMEERRVISPKPFLAKVPPQLLKRIRKRLGEALNFSQKIAVCIENPKSKECEEVFEECLEENTHLCRAFVNIYCKVVGHEKCLKGEEKGMKEALRKLRERWRMRHGEKVEIMENETIEESSEVKIQETVNETVSGGEVKETVENMAGGWIIEEKNTSTSEINEGTMGGEE